MLEWLDDFEVSIFLTETSTSHAMLTKQKTFTQKPRLESNASKLTSYFGNNSENAIHVHDDEEAPAVLLQEEEDADEIKLGDIPEAAAGNTNKRSRDTDDDEHVFVQSEEDEEEEEAPQPRKKKSKVKDTAQDEDDKKKMGIKTAYEGFSIYGRILCLIVKRKGVKKNASGNTAGSQMLEAWVSTQMDNEGVLDDAEDG